MTLRSFLVSLFRGVSANGELEQVREAARQDARAFVGTYLEEFEAEAAKLFTDRSQRFIGFDDDAIEVEATPAKAPVKKGGRK